jgi:hypothetical protein
VAVLVNVEVDTVASVSTREEVTVTVAAEE